MILYLQHIEIEGPETLGDYLTQKGFESKFVHLYKGEALSENLNGIDAVVALGGPMNVYEEKKYAYLKDENIFIQRVIEEEIPYLGLCLGSQLLAKACEAKVGRSPQEEIGFFDLSLTPEARNDPLFEGLPKSFKVYQWHGDMWALPEDGLLLAQSSGCPHQAFRVGSCAYGLQFHVEITDQGIAQWSDTYIKDPQERVRKKEKMLKDYQAFQQTFDKNANLIYDNFLKIIQSYQK